MLLKSNDFTDRLVAGENVTSSEEISLFVRIVNVTLPLSLYNLITHLHICKSHILITNHPLSPSAYFLFPPLADSGWLPSPLCRLAFFLSFFPSKDCHFLTPSLISLTHFFFSFFHLFSFDFWTNILTKDTLSLSSLFLPSFLFLSFFLSLLIYSLFKAASHIGS